MYIAFILDASDLVGTFVISMIIRVWHPLKKSHISGNVFDVKFNQSIKIRSLTLPNSDV